MAINKKSLENLKSTKPGQVLNPNGKPKGTLNAKTIIRKWLEVNEESNNDLTGAIEKLTQLDIITIKQIVRAKSGDTFAFNALLDRTEGKPRQESDINLNGNMVNLNSEPLSPEKIKELNQILENEF